MILVELEIIKRHLSFFLFLFPGSTERTFSFLARLAKQLNLNLGQWINGQQAVCIVCMHGYITSFQFLFAYMLSWLGLSRFFSPLLPPAPFLQNGPSFYFRFFSFLRPSLTLSHPGPQHSPIAGKPPRNQPISIASFSQLIFHSTILGQQHPCQVISSANYHRPGTC
jgi:hypothetical protein